MSNTRERADALAAKTGRNPNGRKRLAEAGTPGWIAAALGVHRTTVCRWGADDWPRYAVAAVELLELVPPEDWPERWR